MINSTKQISHCPPTYTVRSFIRVLRVLFAFSTSIKRLWMRKESVKLDPSWLLELSMSLSLSKINNPSVIACGTIPYFIYAMSHNLEGNYYEYVVYHPALRDKERTGLIIEIKLIRNFARFIHSYIKWNFRNTSCRRFRFITRVSSL